MRQQLLAYCLVEGDRQEAARHRRARLTALVTSVLLQASILAASVLVTLLAAVKPVRWYSVTVGPPYWGSAQAKPQVARGGRTGGHSKSKLWTQPLVVPRTPDRVREAPDANPPADGYSSQIGPSDGVPSGGDFPLSLFGNNDKPRLQPPVSTVVQHPRPSVIRRSEGVQGALLIHRVLPTYPSVARLARVQGTVVLRAMIGRDGAVRSLEAVSGHPLLVQAALEAVGQWCYRPTLLNGNPVEVETLVTVIFRLND